MPSTYSNLKIQLMATGENNTTWGDVTNLNLGTALEEAIVGSADVAFSDADVTLTLTDTNASQTARNVHLNLTGTATAGYNLGVPAIEKPYIVNNDTDGTITIKNSTGTGIAIPAGKTMWVYNNGTNVVSVVNYLPTVTLGTALGVSSGGTGATTLTGYVKGTGTSALTASSTIPTSDLTGTLAVANGGTGQTSYTNGQLLIGNTTGNTLAKATLTAGSGISITNGAGSITIAATGGGSGTVTSVALSGGTTGLTVSGSPITTSGTITLAGTLAAVNGGTGQTSYAVGDLLYASTTTALSKLADVATGNALISGGVGVAPSYGKIGLTTHISGTLAVSNGGTGATTLTGVVIGNGTSAFTTVTAPSGTIVGTTDTQSLTNKTLTTGNTLDAGTSVSDTGTIAAASPGFRGLPQNSQTGAYTLALTDAGKHISITTGGVVIPANGSIAFPVGTTIVIFNNSGSNQTISITTDTLRLAGSTSTGSRTLANYGLATCVKVASTTWVVSGNVS